MDQVEENKDNMTPEQFCYWLQGYAELTESQPTPEQWKMMQEHLQTVFYKVTPSLEQTVVNSLTDYNVRTIC